jgi:hypothetical protein
MRIDLRVQAVKKIKNNAQISQIIYQLSKFFQKKNLLLTKSIF